ncbi:10 kDa heat shock protein, mitochondrial [Clupea harengus]|uniref:10 kDa heat shock protein, mitochondrial n=1 Tax=Clupea harengus TaxID=7950 RepID=A0A6P3VW67_CLUHA|nr:10 kDa heat shock protein, mitochondrial [Clupea harengus]
MRIEFSSFTWVVTQNPACPFLTYRNQGASTGLTNCPTTTKMAFRRFLPMFDRVLVERVAAETVTKGGIMLPEKSMAKVLHATVVAVGPGSVNQKGNVLPVCVKVGEKVLLPEYGGTKVVLEDKDYFLFRDADILGKYVD